MDLRSLEVLFLATQPDLPAYAGPGYPYLRSLPAGLRRVDADAACNSSAFQRPAEGWPATGPQVPMSLQGCLPALSGQRGLFPTGSSHRPRMDDPRFSTVR